MPNVQVKHRKDASTMKGLKSILSVGTEGPFTPKKSASIVKSPEGTTKPRAASRNGVVRLDMCDRSNMGRQRTYREQTNGKPCRRSDDKIQLSNLAKQSVEQQQSDTVQTRPRRRKMGRNRTEKLRREQLARTQSALRLSSEKGDNSVLLPAQRIVSGVNLQFSMTTERAKRLMVDFSEVQDIPQGTELKQVTSYDRLGARPRSTKPTSIKTESQEVELATQKEDRGLVENSGNGNRKTTQDPSLKGRLRTANQVLLVRLNMRRSSL